MKYDQVSRVFTTARSYTTKEGEDKVFVQEYPFTTWSYIYDGPPEDFIVAKVFDYFQYLMGEGRPEIGDRKSVSQLPLMKGVTAKKIDDPIVQDAEMAGYEGGGQDQHRIVQRHLMKFNSSIIASEVPVWNDCTCQFDSPLSCWCGTSGGCVCIAPEACECELVMGHIDYIQWDKARKVLRVLDFKPAAFKEKKAASQLCRYGHLLADRLGIDPKSIELIYFDKDEAYQVIF